MTTPISRTARWRRALAAGAAMTLPLGVAACSDDGNDDPDIINEEGVEEGVEDLEDGASELGEDVEDGASELGDELEDGASELEENLSDDDGQG